MGLRSLSLSQAQAGEGVGSCCSGLCLRRREGGGGVRWRLWNWIWSCCKGIGDRGWAVSEGSKEEEGKSEQGRGDIVFGGCGPEWIHRESGREQRAKKA